MLSARGRKAARGDTSASGRVEAVSFFYVLLQCSTNFTLGICIYKLIHMERRPTTQQISWLLDLDNNKQLDLNPPYQRKSVWTIKDRRFFLDTIMRNYPAPPIFIHRTIDEVGRSTYHVVDGKQRLETILQFANNKITIGADFNDELISGKKFKDIPAEYKRKFWDYVLVVDFLNQLVGIEEVFDRVNRNSRNLQPQELRHARYNGWFISEAEDFSDNAFWVNIRVSTKAKAKRMKNIQFVSELLFVVLEKEPVGFGQEYLDEMYAKYDDIDELPDFDEDEYIAERDRVVGVLKEMEAFNNCVTKFSKTVNNLYTLWSVVALTSDLPEAEELADKYQVFMTKVQDASASTTATEDEDEEDVRESGASIGGEENVVTYVLNSRGASTEPQQRAARFRVLQAVLSK